MLRKLALAIFAVASIAAVTPASADGISGEEVVVRRPHVEYRWREHHYRDDGYRRVRRAEYVRDYEGSCYRVIYTDYGPRRIDTPCD